MPVKPPALIKETICKAQKRTPTRSQDSLAQTSIKEALVSSPTEIEIVWTFRDVFRGHSNAKEEEIHNG